MKKRLKLLSLIVAMFTFAAVPAMGYNPTVREAQRHRAGTSTWTPRFVDANSFYDANNDKTIFEFGFEWYQNEHTRDLEGSEQILEIGLDIPCIGTIPAVNEWTDGSYTLADWATNVPAAALPYEDTMFLDDCTGDNTMSPGVGMANVAALVPGTYYWIRVGSVGHYPTLTPGQQNVALKVQTGTTYDHTATFPWGFSFDCSWTSTEISHWNDTDSFGSEYRRQASWCAWPDFTHTVVTSTSGDLHTGQYKSFNTDKLTNQGFEETTCSGYGCYSVSSGNGVARYCNDAVTPAFDGNCYVTFNRGSNGSIATIQQDVPDPLGGTWPTGYYTAEAAVRCRSGQGVSQCPLTMSYHGIWNSTESYGVSTAIPANNQWYICRADADHRDADNNFTTHHDLLRWQLWNNTTSASLDVDYTFLGGKTKINTNNGAGGNLTPANEPICTAA